MWPHGCQTRIQNRLMEATSHVATRLPNKDTKPLNGGNVSCGHTAAKQGYFSRRANDTCGVCWTEWLVQFTCTRGRCTHISCMREAARGCVGACADQADPAPPRGTSRTHMQMDSRPSDAVCWCREKDEEEWWEVSGWWPIDGRTWCNSFIPHTNTLCFYNMMGETKNERQKTSLDHVKMMR